MHGVALWELYDRQEFSLGVLLASLALLCVLPAWLVYFGLSRWVRYRHGGYAKHLERRFGSIFSGRWLGLWHEGDEAIGALRALGKMDQNIFDRRFAEPIVTALTIPALPLLLYLVHQ